MLDWMFILLFITTIGFMYYAITVEKKDYFWNILLTVISIAMWFILAGGVYEIETSYQIFNVTSGDIETGIHTVSTLNNIFLSYLFMFFGIVCILYLLIIIINLWKKEM